MHVTMVHACMVSWSHENSKGSGIMIIGLLYQPYTLIAMG